MTQIPFTPTEIANLPELTRQNVRYEAEHYPELTLDDAEVHALAAIALRLLGERNDLHLAWYCICDVLRDYARGVPMELCGTPGAQP